MVRRVEPTDPISTDARALSIAGAQGNVWVPVGNRLYGVTSNPGLRPGWVLIDLRRLVVVEPGTLYSTREAAIREAWEREQPD